jgi:hypothetical protein
MAKVLKHKKGYCTASRENDEELDVSGISTASISHVVILEIRTG